MRTDAAPLIEAKKEYIEQLQQLIAKKVYGIFFEFFIKTVETNDDVELVFSDFQGQMEDIRTWNHEKVSEYTRMIIDDDEFFSQLVTAVLILKTKIMTSFKIDNQQKNVQLKVPSNDHFIHRLFMIVGNHFYNNPFVFVIDDNKRINTERYKDCMNMIHSSIEETITYFVPVKNILKEYIGVKDPEGVPSPHEDPKETKDMKEVIKEALEEAKASTQHDENEEIRRVGQPDDDNKESNSEDTSASSVPSVPAPVPIPIPEPPIVPSPILPAADKTPEAGDTKDVSDSDVYPQSMMTYEAPKEAAQELPLEHPREERTESRNPTFDSDSDSESEEEYDYEPSEDGNEEPKRYERY